MEYNSLVVILSAIVYVILIIIVAVMASKRNRIFLGYVILCFFITPIIVIIILIGIGNNYEDSEDIKKHDEFINNLPCPFCSKDIKRDSVFCIFCGGKIPEGFGQIALAGKEGDEYTVIKMTGIRNGPGHDFFIRKTLHVDDKIHLKKVNNKKPEWFYIRTEDSKKGWCFAGHIRKC